jgi:2-keto-4-pentenoate hydratase
VSALAVPVDALAEELLEAYHTRRPVEPLSGRFPAMTADDAYAVQLAQVRRWLTDGAVIKGHKVGLTSKAMQEMLGIDQPDYGHLRDDMLHESGGELCADELIQPRAEPEIGFLLAAELAGPGVTAEQAAGAVEAVVPALEIIDSRVLDWRIKLADTIADNASSGAVVLGAPVDAAGLDLPALGCGLAKNGEVLEYGDGAAVLGDPLAAVVWLANTLGERGTALEPGHVVLPGACTRAIPVTAGDAVEATFERIGSVSARFV